MSNPVPRYRLRDDRGFIDPVVTRRYALFEGGMAFKLTNFVCGAHRLANGLFEARVFTPTGMRAFGEYEDFASALRCAEAYVRGPKGEGF